MATFKVPCLRHLLSENIRDTAYLVKKQKKIPSLNAGQTPILAVMHKAEKAMEAVESDQEHKSESPTNNDPAGVHQNTTPEDQLCINTKQEDIPKLDETVIDRLTTGTLQSVLPQVEKAKETLAELTENQRILIETIQQENAKFSECLATTQVADVMDKAKDYHIKLLNIRKEMTAMHEKSARLKKRALKLQQQKQKEALQKEQQREKEMEKERLLIAKPAKRTE